MATRHRETAVIEPEPYGDEERGLFARLFRLIFGMVLGLAVTAYLIANPQILADIARLYESQVARLPEAYARYSGYGTIALAILFVYLIRSWLVNNAVFYGIAIGAVLWVPFGGHILAAVPQIDDALPKLRPGLERMTESDPRLQKLKAWTETTIPVDSVPSLTELTQGGTESPRTE